MRKKKEETKRDFNNWRKSICFSWKNKEKSAPGKFYKQSVENVSYFNKETVFTVRKKKTIDNIKYYWVKSHDWVKSVG